MIREDLIADCLDGAGDWNELNWDELDLLQERIHEVITRRKTDTLKTILHPAHRTLQ